MPLEILMYVSNKYEMRRCNIPFINYYTNLETHTYFVNTECINELSFKKLISIVTIVHLESLRTIYEKNIRLCGYHINIQQIEYNNIRDILITKIITKRNNVRMQPIMNWKYNHVLTFHDQLMAYSEFCTELTKKEIDDIFIEYGYR